jgi:hypothetical protein
MSKDQANKVLYIKFYKYIGCISIRKLPIKIVVYYTKMIISIVIMGNWEYDTLQ